MRESILYEKTSDSSVKCLSCSKCCILGIEAVGKCGVRKNVEGKLYVINDTKIVTISVEKLEKNTLSGFKTGSKALVIGGVGCNFKCTFCNTWDISQFPHLKAKESSRDKSLHAVQSAGYDFNKASIVKYCKELGCDSIVYTVNEPTIALEYYLDIMKTAKESLISNVWMTNGYFSSESLSLVLPYLDGVNFDFKSFSNEFYRKHCGAELSVVKSNLELLLRRGVYTEVSYILIPGENDSEKEVARFASFIFNLSPEITVKFKKFVPDFRMLDKNVTSEFSLTAAQNVARNIGLKNVY